jgi:hypothetical protein
MQSQISFPGTNQRKAKEWHKHTHIVMHGTVCPSCNFGRGMQSRISFPFRKFILPLEESCNHWFHSQEQSEKGTRVTQPFPYSHALPVLVPTLEEKCNHKFRSHLGNLFYLWKRNTITKFIPRTVLPVLVATCIALLLSHVFSIWNPMVTSSATHFFSCGQVVVKVYTVHLIATCSCRIKKYACQGQWKRRKRPWIVCWILIKRGICNAE